MKKLFGMTAGAMLLAGAASAQTTILYLNFDEAADAANISNNTAYTAGASEVNNGAAVGVNPITFNFRNNSGNGPSIGAAPGGVTGTRQGGKVLLVDSGSGQDEGLELISGAAAAAQGDVTIEVIWYTVDASGGSNTAGIQTPIGNEWPFGATSQLFIRTVGANRMDYYTDRGDSNNERVQILTTPSVVANTWYHDVLVLDYNNATPASSSILAYRNGTLIGTSTYNATGIQGTLFTTGNAGTRKISVGFGGGLDASLSDHHGLNGGVDAIAITSGVLTPANFVLPSGATHSSVSDWSMF